MNDIWRLTVYDHSEKRVPTSVLLGLLRDKGYVQTNLLRKKSDKHLRFKGPNGSITVFSGGYWISPEEFNRVKSLIEK